jgi:FxsC-like protein
MTTGGAEPWRDRRRFYFFLSYAHSPPSSNGHGDRTDFWVAVFFQNLRDRVRDLARAGTDMEIGFSNHLLRPDPEWDVWTANALATSEVFVPLLEPGYLTRAWPMSQYDSFRGRTHASPSPQAREHILPVLWGPWLDSPGNVGLPELDAAMRLCAEVPAYAEQGLRSMCMVSIYRKQFSAVLNILAGRIVELAQDAPLGPSAPLASGVRASRSPGPTSFVVGVLAPVRARLPAARKATSYGASAELWRPFLAQERPVAHAAADVAENFGAPTTIVDYSTDSAAVHRRPGLVLIDPWITRTQGGLELMNSALDNLPQWVIPIVVIDETDPQYASLGANLIDLVVEQLSYKSGIRPRWLHGIDELAQLVPDVVNEATRQYMGQRQAGPTMGRRPRPRISGPTDSTTRQPRTTDE